MDVITDCNGRVLDIGGSGGDTIIVNNSGSRFPASASNVPIVVFIYDDNSTFDDTLVQMLEARNLIATLSTIGNINATSSQALGNKLKTWCERGHGTVGHGLVAGINVTVVGTGLPGLSVIDDEDAHKAIKGNNKYLDMFGLSHHGIAYWNQFEWNPHTIAMVGKYYDYGFQFGGSGYNTPSTDPWRYTRYITDSASMLTGAISLIDSSLGHNCIVAFGGHMDRTGKGGDYSTMADFTTLLDYVAEKVANRQMIALNADDAVATLFGRCSVYGAVRAGQPYAPSVGNMYLHSNGIKVCTNEGALSVYDITLSGVPSEGEIEIRGLSLNAATGIRINVTSGMSIGDIINKCLDCVYKRCTASKIGVNTLRLNYDVAEVTTMPYVYANTSNLDININQSIVGVAPTWM